MKSDEIYDWNDLPEFRPGTRAQQLPVTVPMVTSTQIWGPTVPVNQFGHSVSCECRRCHVPVGPVQVMTVGPSLADKLIVLTVCTVILVVTAVVLVPMVVALISSLAVLLLVVVGGVVGSAGMLALAAKALSELSRPTGPTHHRGTVTTVRKSWFRRF